MSYPQPDPNQYAIGGQKFWRLNTNLVTDGDIYESQQGSAGFAIGPDSDISKVNIAYFDDQVPASGFQNQISISPSRPFAGSLYARNDAAYVPSGRQGRFLIWPAERFNNEYDPAPSTDGNPARVDIVSPVLDVVEYFSPTPGVTQGRNDKEYHAQTIPWGVPDNTWANWVWLIPFYGRRYASITLSSKDAPSNPVAAFAVKPFGVTFRMAQASELSGIATPFADINQSLIKGAEATVVVKASARGMFDYLQLVVTGGDAPNTDCTIRVRVSDTEV